MNSYRIDTFQLEDGTWKAAMYQCGSYLGEYVSFDEFRAILGVALVGAGVEKEDIDL